jgi:hypothetical protein
MRMIVLAMALLVGCSSSGSSDQSPPWQCNYPDPIPAGTSCVCFDGDVRCNQTCPMDLSLACTPGDGCGDLSGGSAGQDCECTCEATGHDPTGHWTCQGPGGACIPM